MVQFSINRKNVFLQFFIADVLQFQRLDGIGEEAACRFKYGVRVTHQVYEFSVREHFYQLFHTSGMRRIFAEELCTVGIPQRNLDEFGKGFFKHFQFGIADIIEQQVLICIFLHVFRQEPEVIVRVGHHVSQGKFFFLRKVYGQFHVVCRAFVRHQPAHVLFEERLPPHHQVREYCLIGSIIAEVLVAREYVVHERGSTAPVSEDKYRIMFQWLVGQQLFVTFVLQRSQRR